MTEVTSVEFVLENCEVLDFDRENIGNFWCSNIHDNISRCGCNSIRKYKSCDEVFIELKRDSDTTYFCFGEVCKETKFERLVNGRDITHIKITYADGASEYIAVPWSDYDENYNDSQTYYLSVYGNLYLMISDDREVAEVIDKEEVNSEDTFDYYC